LDALVYVMADPRALSATGDKWSFEAKLGKLAKGKRVAKLGN